MSFKDIKKKIKRQFEWVGFSLFYKFLSTAKKETIYSIGSRLGTYAYYLIKKYRDVSEESLGIAFGDTLDKEKAKQITKESIQEMFKSGAELIYFCRISKEEVKKAVKVQGLENLDKAIKKGKGIIALSAHMGSFPLIGIRLKYEGYNIGFIIRRQRDPRIENILFTLREKMDVKTIYNLPRFECVHKSLDFLKSNGILVIQLDQNFGSGKGVFVDFFGKLAATATGPVVMSMRTGAPVVPIFIVRNPDDTHQIFIEPELELDVAGDNESDVLNNTAKFVKVMEKYARAYPSMWSWIHKRWKSRPADEPQQ